MKHRTNSKHESGFNHKITDLFSVQKIGQGTKHNKRGLRASGLSLLPLALRPGLLMMSGIIVTGLVAITGLVLSNSVSAASISLSVPNTLSLNINSASLSGTFSKSDKAEISTKTDSKNGYTLSIKSKEDVDSNCLKNDKNDNKIESIPSSISESEYESSGQMNTWAYQSDMFNSLANSNFLPGPTSSETVLDKTKVGNDLVHNYGIVLAAKVNTDLPAGTYKNTYVLTATSNALIYSVHYNNLEDTTDGPSPNPQTGQSDGNTFKLSESIPKKEGMKFKGWCTTQPAEDGTCNGGTYQPGSDYTIFCDDNDIELYAMWGEPGTSSGTTMQDFTCNLAEGETTTVTDIRDGNTYKVAKLKDGRCWMTENLRIVNKELTPLDSNISSNFTLPNSNLTSSSFSEYNISYVYIDGTRGGYYSWFAATAGQGTKSKTAGSTVYSICPKGWRLPTQDEQGALTDMYSNKGDLNREPANFDYYSGYYEKGVIQDKNKYSAYWSSTPDTESYASDMRAWSNGIGNANHLYKFMGASVRCVSK